LPSLQDLRLWQSNGIGHLLNVSGIDIRDIYAEKDLKPFSITQTTFADVFSAGVLVDADIPLETVTTDVYLQLSTEEHRLAFLTAVQTLIEQLKSHTPTCVFCHRGQGRSPLVAAAATGLFYRESIPEAIARIRIIRPPALFTDISVSALLWCIEQQAKS
jgi:hypothetical protein